MLHYISAQITFVTVLHHVQLLQSFILYTTTDHEVLGINRGRGRVSSLCYHDNTTTH